jgi:hypothetical protein
MNFIKQGLYIIVYIVLLLSIHIPYWQWPIPWG